MCEIDNDEAHRLRFEIVVVNQRTQILLNGDDGTEEEETAKLDNADLATDLAEVAAVRSRPSDCRFRYDTTVGSSDGWVAGTLNDLTNAGKDNTHKDANDEVMDTHDQNNGYNGKVLELMALAESVP